MSDLKTVKRYANRKLYDTERSCYVTLEDISVMIRGGENVQVIDNKSGENLTTVTLAQIIFEAEKKKNFMPLDLLRGLIKDATATLGQFGQDLVPAIAQAAEEPAQVPVEAEQDAEQAEQDKPEATLTARELFAQTKNSFDDLKIFVDEKLVGPVGNMARYAGLGRDLEEARRRLAELESRLETFPE